MSGILIASVVGYVPKLLYPTGTATVNFGTGVYDLIVLGALEKLTNGGVVYKASVNLGNNPFTFGSNPQIIVALDNGSNNYTVVFRQTITAPVVGNNDYSLSPGYAVPATGNFYLGFSFTGAADAAFIATTLATGRDRQYAYNAGNLTVGSSATFTNSTSDLITIAPWM